jgi:hypothetical protein
MINMWSRSSRRMVPAKRSAMALARGACTGRPDDLDAARGEDGVEGRGELGVAIADEEWQSPGSVVEVHGQVAG